MGKAQNAPDGRLYDAGGVRLAIGFDLVGLRHKVNPPPGVPCYASDPDPARRGPAVQAAYAAGCRHQYQARLGNNGPLCCAQCGAEITNGGGRK